MHAYLIIGNNTEYERDPSNVLRMTGAKKIEFPFAKIADVRELNNFTKFKLSEKTAIVLKDFDKASEEAQNAFLKALEEPQENLIYILTATNIEKVLPTIVSRCEVVDTGYSILDIKNEDKESANKFIAAEVGGKLKIISTINKREEAIEFVKNLILTEHKVFLEKPEMAVIMETANQTLKNLEANGNVQLQLTNFVVSTSS